MYRYACWNRQTKSITLFTWDKQGNRVTLDKPYKPYLYYEDKRGEYKSIFGTPLKRKEFSTPFDRNKFIADSRLTRLFENIKPAQQFLIDEYEGMQYSPNFMENPLKICFFDIETEPTPHDEFPLDLHETPTGEIVVTTKSPISLITIHNNLNGRYTTFGTRPFTGELPDDLDCEFIYCQNEGQMLEKFLQYIEEDHPDILSAWNSNFFDAPYLVERIRRILGSEHLVRLSPINNFYESTGKTKDNPPRKFVKYITDGMTIIDYMDVYKKFKVKLLDTYKLDYIGELEIGRKKLEYSGTIGEFQRKDWNTFVLYNIRDVELLVKIDKKTNYFSLYRLLGTFGLTNYEDSLGVVAYNVGALTLIAREKGKKLFTPQREVTTGKNEGGYVSVHTGLTRDLFTLDFSSLYPNIDITLNISPETKVGKIEIWDVENDVYNLTLTSGKSYKIPKNKLDEFIKAKNLIISEAGILFDQSIQGIVPEHMERVFNQRKKARKDLFKNEEELGPIAMALNNMSENDPEYKKLAKKRDKLVAEIIRLDALQYALKLSINSLYGCLTSKSSPIGDDDLGNSITLSGQAAIKSVNEYVRNYIRDTYCNDLTEQEIEELVQFNDTDSCGITLRALHKRGVTICENGKVTEEGYRIINDISDKVNQHMIDWSKEHFNTNRCTLDLKREKICDFGLYRKKKNYILHVIDDEGKVDEVTGELKTKWHYSGIELAKAIMTKQLKELGKKVIEPMVLEQDRFKTDKMLQNAYDQFKELPLEIICKLARIKTFDKYVRNCEAFKCAKGMQQHVRAAYYHNLILEKEKITGYQPLMQGDDCQILPVKPTNKYRIDCIAFRTGECPKEFLDIFEPDYVAMFEKPFYSCISSLYAVAGWPCKKVTDEYENYDIFDLFA